MNTRPETLHQPSPAFPLDRAEQDNRLQGETESLLSKIAQTHQSNKTTRANHHASMPMTSSNSGVKNLGMFGDLETSAHLDLELTR